MAGPPSRASDSRLATARPRSMYPALLRLMPLRRPARGIDSRRGVARRRSFHGGGRDVEKADDFVRIARTAHRRKALPDAAAIRLVGEPRVADHQHAAIGFAADES